MDQRRALDDAYRATSMLYNSEYPLPTHLWCIKQVSEHCRKDNVTFYKPVNCQRAKVIYTTLEDYVKTLNVQSPEYFVEKDYFDKLTVFRNWYEPESLRQQAEVSAWFLGGSVVPEPMTAAIEKWWQSRVPKGYRVLSPGDIKCPKFEASAGVCFVRTPNGYDWEYLEKGPNWSRIQDGTTEWLKMVCDAVPKEWLSRPVSKLLNARNEMLELLGLERPVIRKESGPGKVRWARSSSGNIYILGRMFAQEIQNGALWSESPDYIGKASNTTCAANRSVRKGEEWYVGTHGDDWLAYCPDCGMWHSGDWSNFDLHVSARQMLASKQAWFEEIEHLLTEEQKKWFYALAYYSIRCPTVWLWDKSGKPKMSIRRTLGKVRSGSGEFILDNNAINSGLLHWLLPTVHEKIHTQRPCKSKRWWPWMSELAATQGWVLKPSAQFTHPTGFIACRCIHRESEGYIPRPSISSVIRNYINPAYDPEEYPNSARDLLVVRFRELNKTMAWAHEEIADVMMGMLVDVHKSAGVSDPWGGDMSNAELSRAITRVVDQYSTRSYLEGGEKD